MYILYILTIFRALEPGNCKTVTGYGTEIHASVEKDNVFAYQFHPEKSGKYGLEILKNFAENGRKKMICLQKESFPAWM